MVRFYLGFYFYMNGTEGGVPYGSGLMSVTRSARPST